MPPPNSRSRVGPDCFPPSNGSAAIIDRNLTTRYGAGKTETNTSGGTQQDMQALMYIVCVLLFYSLGIVVGIITYLKKEKREIEESKMLDEFVTLINERQPHNRLIKVQEVIRRLEALQSNKELVARNTSVELTLPCGASAESAQIYSEKNTYTSVLTQSSPLGVVNNPYAVYETLDTFKTDAIEARSTSISIMDATPKMDTESSTERRNEDGYVSDTDPFQNKRLSQVVAQILDTNTEIGAEDVFDDVDGVCDFDDDEDVSLCTDFIDYKEEPKNKELFRDNERTQSSEFPAPPKLKTPSVNESTALLESEDVSSTHSPTTTTFDVDDVDKVVTQDVPRTGFRWSVTSV